MTMVIITVMVIDLVMNMVIDLFMDMIIGYGYRINNNSYLKSSHHFE